MNPLFSICPFYYLKCFLFTENCPNWKKNRKFKEGWVEFSSKKVAKMVAANLNNKQVGGKRHNPWYYDLWNIKLVF